MNRITNKPEPAATIMATDADFDVQNGDGLGVTNFHCAGSTRFAASGAS